MRDVDRKLSSATRNFQRLQAEVASVGKPDYRLVLRGTSVLEFHATSVPPFDDEWTEQIATIMQQARSSLDYLAAELARVKAGGGPLDEKTLKLTDFPITTKENAFIAKRKKLGSILRPIDLQRMEELQLHNAYRADLWGASPTSPHPLPVRLAILHDLNIVDKHHRLRPVGWSSNSSTDEDSPGGYPGVASKFVKMGMDHLKKDQQFMTWNFDEAPDPQDLTRENLDKYVKFFLDIDSPLQFRWDAIEHVLIASRDGLNLVRECLETAQTVARGFRPAVIYGLPPLTTIGMRQLQPDVKPMTLAIPGDRLYQRMQDGRGFEGLAQE